VSQPWQERTWPERRGEGGNASPAGGPGGNWSRGRIVLGGQPPGREPGRASPPARDGGHDSEPDADGAYAGSGAPASHRPGALLTGRGALLGMLVLFFLGILAATWLGWSPLAGASFVLGCAAAAWRTKPRDLLSAVVSPPLLFFAALVGVKVLTATGDTLVSVAGGTVLTLASVAPWLLAGVAISLIIAWFRGLRRCVSDLRRAARADLQADRAQQAGNARLSGPAGPRTGSGGRR
jgi:hypothetical protein